MHATANAEGSTWGAGLSSTEAGARLRRDGANELPRVKRRAFLAILLEILREPMFLMLAAAAVLYALLGDLAEALVLSASVVVVVGLTLYQEDRSERALRALRDLASPRAAVMRDGRLVRIAARELVVGDTVMVSEGDRVPADLGVLEAHDLRVDESVLTGESAPVGKRIAEGTVRPGRPGDADSSMLFASTLVIAGHAFGEVLATGAHTELGRIGRSLGDVAVERSPLQREIAKAVVVFATLGLGLCALVVALRVSASGWIDGLLAGITLAIANIPEELPVVISVFVAIGAWRLSRRHVLTRRPAAIEALGAVTVLCTDKTGTLTENRMTVVALDDVGGERWAIGGQAPAIPSALHGLLRHAALACEISPFDPMEKAILALAQAEIPDAIDATRGARLVREYPLSPELPAHTHVWRFAGATGFAVACKGAPEAVATLCGLDAGRRAVLLEHAGAMASSALRVIAVAAARWPIGEGGEDALPDAAAGFEFELLGLVGLKDPLRDGADAAVADATTAGVRTMMLTGDYPATAAAIAADAGIAPRAAEIVTGATIDAFDDAALRSAVARHRVFARMRPEQKLRLVEALKANGEIVAMTGDGVNDAPALRASHVGIAMGGRGADVAREAASIVLLDDNFVSIVGALRLGRIIYDNIARALRFVLAVHVPISGIALLPLLVGGPLVLWPVHVVFLELIVDPACSLAFEREPAEADVMRRPPRDPERRLLDLGAAVRSLLVGAVALLAAAATYLAAWRSGLPDGAIAALTFASIVSGNLGLIALHRTGGLTRARGRPANPVLRWIAALALAGLATGIYVPAVAALFRFAVPPSAALVGAIAAPLLALLLIDRLANPRGLRGT